MNDPRENNIQNGFGFINKKLENGIENIMIIIPIMNIIANYPQFYNRLTESSKYFVYFVILAIYLKLFIRLFPSSCYCIFFLFLFLFEIKY